LLNQQARMVGVNTAIARMAVDGMPIASISFSLKSAVVTQWLSRHGVFAMAPATQTNSSPARVMNVPPAPVSESPVPMPAQPRAGSSAGSPTNPATIVPSTPARPYNLDQLVSEQSKAEADLGKMMIEMRGRFKGQ